MCKIFPGQDIPAAWRNTHTLTLPPSWSFEFEYDEYGCSGCTDDICRDAVYEGLRLEDAAAINVPGLLAHFLEWDEQQITDDLFAYGVDVLGLQEADTYLVYGEPGYYGDEAAIELYWPQGIEQLLTEYLLSH